MTTRVDIQTRVRQELNDSGGTPLWSTTLLNVWIPAAIRQWSADYPRQLTTTIASVANQQAYSLPSNWLRVVRVEHPDGVFRQLGPLGPGEEEPGAVLAVGELQTRAPGGLWAEVWADQLVLTPAPSASGENIVVRYVASYTEPSADGTVLDVAARDEDAIVYHVCAAALQYLGTDESKRQRWERERGSSPTAERRVFLEQYEACRSRRLAGVRSRRLVVRGET